MSKRNTNLAVSFIANIKTVGRVVVYAALLWLAVPSSVASAVDQGDRGARQSLSDERANGDQQHDAEGSVLERRLGPGAGPLVAPIVVVDPITGKIVVIDDKDGHA